jgi:hypothetical protein
MKGRGAGTRCQRAACARSQLHLYPCPSTHPWRSAGPPAPGCRRRWAAGGRAREPSARCSLNGTENSMQGMSSAAQARFRGLLPHAQPSPKDRQSVVCRSTGVQAAHPAGSSVPPSSRWGRPGPSGTGSATPRAPNWQTPGWPCASQRGGGLPRRRPAPVPPPAGPRSCPTATPCTGLGGGGGGG